MEGDFKEHIEEERAKRRNQDRDDFNNETAGRHDSERHKNMEQ